MDLEGRLDLPDDFVDRGVVADKYHIDEEESDGVTAAGPEGEHIDVIVGVAGVPKFGGEGMADHLPPYSRRLPQPVQRLA